MPTLAYDDQGTPRAGRLNGRALIGRRLSHGVVLADAGVSRLHAWVDRDADGRWVVTDAGSKTGVRFDGQLVYRHVLADGDAVIVGDTAIAYRDADALPAGTEAAVLSPPAGEAVRTSGLLFECGNCHAPIWVGNDLAGKRGRCRHCKGQIVAPAVHEVVDRQPTPPPATVPAGRRPQCGVCHATVAESEQLTVCPECDTTYHGECWAENYGCSTYGCGHVDALNPNAPPKATATADAPTADAPTADAPTPAVALSEPPPRYESNTYFDDDDDDGRPRFQWEWITVGAAVLAAVLGVASFGGTSLAMAVVVVVMLARRRPGARVGLLVLALLIGIVGTVAGLALSDYWFLAGKHLPAIVRR